VFAIQKKKPFRTNEMINLMVIGKKVFGVLDQLIGLLQKAKIIGLLQKVQILFPWQMNNSI
jgi:hypothetical protein